VNCAAYTVWLVALLSVIVTRGVQHVIVGYDRSVMVTRQAWKERRWCPLGLVYEESPAVVIKFPACVVGLLALKAHSSNAAVPDVMPVSGPISFDISARAKNYGLQQRTSVQKNALCGCAGGEKGR